jgi:hypothetical protein
MDGVDGFIISLYYLLLFCMYACKQDVYAQALAGARQVHEFDRSAEETAAWVAEKEAQLGAELQPPRSLAALRDLRRRHHALHADLHALRAAHATLAQEADRYGVPLN